MKNFIQEGNTIPCTAPSGGVVSGRGYLFGGLFVVALTSAAEGLPFEGTRRGVFSLTAETHATDQALAVGDVAFWDATNARVTKTKTGNTAIGVVTAAKASTATAATVVLVPRMAAAVDAIAAPTGGSTIDAEARTAIGSILTALRNVGLVKA